MLTHHRPRTRRRAPTAADSRTRIRYRDATEQVTPAGPVTGLGCSQRIDPRREGRTTSGPADIRAATTEQLEYDTSSAISIPAAEDREFRLRLDRPARNGAYPATSGPSGEAVAK